MNEKYLDGDVEQIVRDHLGRLGRAPAFAASRLTAGRMSRPVVSAVVVARVHVRVDQLHVVQPRQEVVQETLRDRRSGRLQAVANFCERYIVRSPPN
jgi:hypothetical protein